MADEPNDNPNPPAAPAPQDGPPAAPATPAPQPPAPAQPAAPAASDKGKRPWGDDENFDPDRAARLIANKDSDIEKLRERLESLEPLAKQAKELEDAKKSTEQRLTEERDQLKTTAQEASGQLARMNAVLAAVDDETPEGAFVKKILSMAKRVTGSTPEELEADAKELMEQLGLGAGRQSQPAGTGGRRAPRETLLPGAVPNAEEPDETDPRKLAALVPRGF